MKLSYAVLIPAMLALSACGTNKTDRAAGGALIGAGAGALIGSTVAAPVAGAAIGAGVGATVGAVTDVDQINLGKVWWK